MPWCPAASATGGFQEASAVRRPLQGGGKGIFLAELLPWFGPAWAALSPEAREQFNLRALQRQRERLQESELELQHVVGQEALQRSRLATDAVLVGRRLWRGPPR